MKRFLTGFNLSSVITITVVASIITGLVTEFPFAPIDKDRAPGVAASPPANPAPLPRPDALQAVRAGGGNEADLPVDRLESVNPLNHLHTKHHDAAPSEVRQSAPLPRSHDFAAGSSEYSSTGLEIGSKPVKSSNEGISRQAPVQKQSSRLRFPMCRIPNLFLLQR